MRKLTQMELDMLVSNKKQGEFLQNVDKFKDAVEAATEATKLFTGVCLSDTMRGIMRAKREEGFYWVKITCNDWDIAQWVNGYWAVFGSMNSFDDDDFVEINETKIEGWLK